jgi:hypothetical protein
VARKEIEHILVVARYLSQVGGDDSANFAIMVTVRIEEGADAVGTALWCMRLDSTQ